MTGMPRLPRVLYLCEWSSITEAGIACDSCSRESGEVVRHPVLPSFVDGVAWVSVCPRTNFEVGLCLPQEPAR